MSVTLETPTLQYHPVRLALLEQVAEGTVQVLDNHRPWPVFVMDGATKAGRRGYNRNPQYQYELEKMLREGIVRRHPNMGWPLTLSPEGARLRTLWQGEHS